ncbi:MAG: 50S ribosomal protein L11 methyltransferase [Chlamydiales bacterium]|nr:50S ribosomal protein L11 methyltransferase [Chlamydiales bacterium]
MANYPIFSNNILNMIDWTKQWEQFAPNFEKGYAHIDLKRYGAEPPLRLKPGPGFGDLSHPTTRLMLESMAPEVKGKMLVDIGSGSGILTLAAWLLGATQCIGIDIDPDAVVHARENAKVNGAEEGVEFFPSTSPPALKGPLLILLNMISSEQQIAKEMYKNLFTQAEQIIASGILATQRDHYLNLAHEWGWKLAHEKEREGWLALSFLK